MSFYEKDLCERCFSHFFRSLCLSITSASSSQLFTEYGRLAMDEIFLKPFQVRENLDCC